MSECHIDHKISVADTLSQTHLCALAIVYVASMAVRSTTARGWQCGKMLVAYHQHLLPLNDRTSWLLCVYGYLFVAANVYVQLFICMGICLYICVLQLYAIRVALQKCLLLGSCCCCMLLIFSSFSFFFNNGNNNLRAHSLFDRFDTLEKFRQNNCCICESCTKITVFSQWFP